MSLTVETNYAHGIPQTAVAGWAPRGAGWHWDASAGGRAGWEGTIRHLINTRWTVNASYHGGFWVEHTADHVGCRTIIQWIVPTTVAAHSVAPSQVWQYHPAKDRTTQDARFAEVRRILARDSDPNADMLAVAYSGMPDGLERDLACPVFRADVQNLGRQLVAHPTVIDRPHFGHGWIQPISRYEMDVATDFIALLYGEAEDDMKIRAIISEDWTAKPNTVFTVYDPASRVMVQKAFTEAVRLTSIAELTLANGMDARLVPFGSGEALIVPRGSLSPIAGTRVVGLKSADCSALEAKVLDTRSAYFALQEEAAKAIDLRATQLQSDAKAIRAKTI